MSEPLITANGLYKVFGPNPDEAIKLAESGLSKDDIFERTGSTIGVQDAAFEVREGEIFVVMGLSGSGKSTLLRLINRLIEPTAGRITIGGRDALSLSRKELIRLRRNEITMVFQTFALLPHLSVRDNAAFGLRVAGCSRGETRKRADRALEQVGLQANADSYPDELSGGMQQRVGLARALAMDPPVWLMDEAFSALDPLIRTRMQDELLELQARKPRTIIFISHDLDEAMRLGDRIAIMEAGRVLQVGTAEEILEDPADEYVRSFFGGVDVAHVYQADYLATREGACIVCRDGLDNRDLRERLRDSCHGYACLEDAGQRFAGLVSRTSVDAALDNGEHDPEAACLNADPVKADASFNEVLDKLVEVDWPVPVVDASGVFKGVVSRRRLLETIQLRAGENE